MKYEMIFGDQSLFDNASDGAVLAIKDTTSGRIHFFTNKGWIKSGLKHERHIGTNDNGIAMRRIIKEPKQWTWEDKKAGRLPDVGSLIMEVESQDSFEFVGVNAGSNRWACKDACDGLLYFFKSHEMSPIETPEEKAARLEDEFVASVIDLASENQLMSCGFKDGVIAAYRKLKGGE